MLSSGVYGACSHSDVHPVDENILQTLAYKLELDHNREWFQGSQFTERIQLFYGQALLLTLRLSLLMNTNVMLLGLQGKLLLLISSVFLILPF